MEFMLFRVEWFEWRVFHVLQTGMGWFSELTPAESRQLMGARVGTESNGHQENTPEPGQSSFDKGQLG